MIMKKKLLLFFLFLFLVASFGCTSTPPPEASETSLSEVSTDPWISSDPNYERPLESYMPRLREVVLLLQRLSLNPLTQPKNFYFCDLNLDSNYELVIDFEPGNIPYLAHVYTFTRKYNPEGEYILIEDSYIDEMINLYYNKGNKKFQFIGQKTIDLPGGGTRTSIYQQVLDNNYFAYTTLFGYDLIPNAKGGTDRICYARNTGASEDTFFNDTISEKEYESRYFAFFNTRNDSSMQAYNIDYAKWKNLPLSEQITTLRYSFAGFTYDAH
jgi:hypothetical protein